MPHQYDVREQIPEIESITGNGTELVTLTVPPEKNITNTRMRIEREHAEAEHIKSDTTRRHVQQALQRIQRTLTQYDEIPVNGLIIYAGVIDGDLESYVFDKLPSPVHESTYRCDNHFHTDALADSITPEDAYALLVIERGGAAIGSVRGDRITTLHTLDSDVMGKTRAGGQSAQRFKRERERQKHEFFTRVAETVSTEFTANDLPAGIVIGGTLGTAKEFVDGQYLNYRLQDRIVGTYPVAYGNEQGLEELVRKAREDVLDETRAAERDVLDAFFTRLRTADPVVYGEDAVTDAITYGAVETLIVASTVPSARREALSTRVENQGGNVIVTATETDHGARFADTFTIGALLRFPIN